jgi:hypothetical protein
LPKLTCRYHILGDAGYEYTPNIICVCCPITLNIIISQLTQNMIFFITNTSLQNISRYTKRSETPRWWWSCGAGYLLGSKHLSSRQHRVPSISLDNLLLCLGCYGQWTPVPCQLWPHGGATSLCGFRVNILPIKYPILNFVLVPITVIEIIQNNSRLSNPLFSLTVFHKWF